MGYINMFGDYVADYIITLMNNRGTIIERTVTAKCDYMAIDIAERWVGNHYKAISCAELIRS